MYSGWALSWVQRSLAWRRARPDRRLSLATASRNGGQSRSAGCSSGVLAGRWTRWMPSGITRSLATCQPARSKTRSTCLSLPTPTLRELGEHGTHGGRVDPAQKPPLGASTLMHEPVNVHPLVAMVPGAEWAVSFAFSCPHPADGFEAQARLVLAPDRPAGERPARPLPRRRAFFESRLLLGVGGTAIWRGRGTRSPKPS